MKLTFALSLLLYISSVAAQAPGRAPDNPRTPLESNSDKIPKTADPQPPDHLVQDNAEFKGLSYKQQFDQIMAQPKFKYWDDIGLKDAQRLNLWKHRKAFAEERRLKEVWYQKQDPKYLASPPGQVEWERRKIDLAREAWCDGRVWSILSDEQKQSIWQEDPKHFRNISPDGQEAQIDSTLRAEIHKDWTRATAREELYKIYQPPAPTRHTTEKIVELREQLPYKENADNAKKLRQKADEEAALKAGKHRVFCS
ncbi:hypothetical protein MGU_09915 [Metarhizium guizhouense ARSEF 977]|uniref:Uncharacterized protein n=1 Tax=Metarhizium guizhouense (strain ARSEF 977) TaxID=1276136 RepID=A0A0B4GJV0_METGA|nr:hypothetical protein MGU_09915 [Metarhizium guizhouense ARSEF 977]